MKRRNLIKSLGLGLIGASHFPAWANNWSDKDLDFNNIEPSGVLSKFVDVTIPETNSPGAKSIGAHLYIQRILNDCYPTNFQKEINETAANINKAANTRFGKSFENLQNNEALDIIKSNATDTKNINFLKNLTIRAYTSSEYYLTTHKNYQMAPGFFHGCVEI
ncbi:gluconate 2-dehydrogenase subunit 3 family protein [Lacihabitans sp. LS3-19]|uniref:gluconate 2-dehydrogenase subunit 3 family protein n=1 Tax=Lacihabitans sp. LS3-19 TaxID=2487335 RepID=UPI0020CEE8F4|nr:gluconate 2-dehydrogenase subunit 3 family protein [Lacihabitans sp. LS3-19]MCP9768124.1 gluconate 2-dehydrogenase subunit 3 family protein [Lacihabitans sp. LS3-19]